LIQAVLGAVWCCCGWVDDCRGVTGGGGRCGDSAGGWKWT